MLRKIGLSPVQILAIGFALIILMGGILLSLPLCSRSGEGIPFIDGLFTAASATCVTGLTVYDIFSQFNFFGQCIILLLVQIGGLGFMGIAVIFSFLLGSKIGIFQRSILMESIGTPHMGGVVRVIRRMLLGSLLFEVLGSAVIAARFIPRLGLAEGIWYGVFHGVSAFCNAGFDLLGAEGGRYSLMHYAASTAVLVTVMALIVIGGLGFFVWGDIIAAPRRRRLQLHTKLVLATSAVLTFAGAGPVPRGGMGEPRNDGRFPRLAESARRAFSVCHDAYGRL